MATMSSSAAKLNAVEPEEPEVDNKCQMSCIHGAWTQNVFCRYFLDYRSIVSLLALATTVVILRIYVGQSNDDDIPMVTMPLRGEFRVTMGAAAGEKNYMDLYIDDANGLRTYLGEGIPEYKGRPNSCSSRDKKYCWLWESDLRLEIHQDPKMDSCQIVSWWSDNTLANLTDCFILGNWNWYGGGNPVWPLQRTAFKGISATTGGWPDRTSIMERYWITSAGVAIKAADDVPLFLSLDPPTNDSNSEVNSRRRLCLTAHYGPPYRHSYPGAPVLLRYHVCYGLNLTDVFLKTRNYFFRKPTGIPDENMITKPVWSTWVRYENKTNSSLILDFAKEVVDNGFINNSQLEIDDQWETCYGDHRFDPVKFPDPVGLVNQLKGLGFRVTLWIHPFINLDCVSYGEAEKSGYLVKNSEGKAGTTNWWRGKASIVDMTNEAAIKWLKGRLQNILDEYGFDSFKFDAGESNLLPYDFVLGRAAEYQPNVYSTAYASLAATFGNLTEIRIGSRTQQLPVFVRLIDRDSNWGNSTTTGIQSVIPIILQYGLLGYPFVMPDMVGGNAYAVFPNRELYIRWVQLNTFLPCIQFSIAPWQYDSEVVRITQKMLTIRSQYSTLFLKTARQGMRDGAPMIRPLWWLDPVDYEAQTIDTQFLVGEDILVAPVLVKGVRGRDIFFPKGKWKCTKDNKIYTGPLWVMHYPVALDELAYFERIND